MMPHKPNDVDDYITGYPKDVQLHLQEIRKCIQSAAPDAQEKISYAMPTFTFHGNLIHFAAYRNHIGLYPAPRAVEAFQAELSRYKGAKGSVQFPLTEPMPLELIARIVQFRVKENQEKAAAKINGKKSKQ